jgi:hypothetical protein
VTQTPATATFAGLQQTYSAKEVTDNFGIDLSVKNLTGTFSAELNASYASETDVYQSYTHGGVVNVVNGYQMSFSPAPGSTWRDYLLKAVEDDIDNPNVRADTLVDTYGTHFIASGYFGGAWIYQQSVANYTKDSATDVEANLDLHVNDGYQKYKTDIAAGQSEFSSTGSGETEAVFFTKGGVFRTADTFDAAYNNWAESVRDQGSFALIAFAADYQQLQSLQPLSVLAADSTRAAEIDVAIQRKYATPYPVSTLSVDLSKEQSVTVAGSHDGNMDLSIEIPDADSVFVGVAWSVKDGELHRLAGQFMDLSTGEARWLDAQGNQPNMSQYEMTLSLIDEQSMSSIGADKCPSGTPCGVAVTGLCLKSNAKDPLVLKLYYQEILLPGSSGRYLGTTVETAEVQTDNKHGCDVEYLPPGGNTSVMTGFGARVSKNKGLVRAMDMSAAPLKVTTAKEATD